MLYPKIDLNEINHVKYYKPKSISIHENMSKKKNLQYKQANLTNIPQHPIENDCNLAEFRKKNKTFEEKKIQNNENFKEINSENNEIVDNSKKKVLLSRLKKYKAIATAAIEKDHSHNYLQENKNVVTNIRKRKMRLFY